MRLARTVGGLPLTMLHAADGLALQFLCIEKSRPLNKEGLFILFQVYRLGVEPIHVTYSICSVHQSRTLRGVKSR